MIYIWIAKKLYAVYKVLPMNVVQMCFGIGLCFFGGTYFMSIAAIEAFRNFGGQLLLNELELVWEQAQLVNEAHEVDQKVDANHDGVADVEVMSASEYVTHKSKVAMVAITQPDKVVNSMQYLLTAWVAVIATLKMQFARTVALALGIAEMFELPACQFLGPPLAMLMGKDLQHWVGPIIIVVIKCTAVYIATYIQSIISAFYSGLRGGRLFASGFINFLHDNFGSNLPSFLCAQPFDPDQSYWDEVIGFTLGAAGFYYQFTHNFQLEFPYSLALFPCTIVETIIRYNVYT